MHLASTRSLLLTTAALLACNGEDVTAPRTGSLAVSTVTAGAEPDTGGYSLLIDGTEHGAVGAAATVTLSDITPGPHTLGLSNVAGNCVIQGDNPRGVTVVAGEITTIAFDITCATTAGPTGTIFVLTTTHGNGAGGDPDGYTLVLDTTRSQPISGVFITSVPQGSHSLELSGVAASCVVDGANPLFVTVSAGDTVQVTFTISCVPDPAPGGLQVNITTTGSSLDTDGYRLALRYRGPVPIGVNAALTVAPVAAGEQPVGLVSVADNCVVQGQNPQTVDVTLAQTATVAFTVVCRTPVAAPWTRMPSGTTDMLTHVSGSSATDVFATQVGDEPNCPGFCGRGAILHFDGMAWSKQFTDTGSVLDIWSASAGDAFALGAGLAPGALLHFDGAGWSPMAMPAPNPELYWSLWALWGSSGRDVFAVGDQQYSEGSDDERPFILHFDGTAWSEMQVPSIETLGDVWGSSPSDVYAVGGVHYYDLPADRAVVLHYDGSQWSSVLDERHLGLARVWGSSATDVYAVGVTWVPSGEYDEETAGPGAIRHFDGSRWSTVQSPTSAPLTAIWGSSAADIYVLAAGGPGHLWHFNGVDWTQLNVGGGALTDIWGSSANDVYAVGTDGTILHGP
jgi:hypothetical protein